MAYLQVGSIVGAAEDLSAPMKEITAATDRLTGATSSLAAQGRQVRSWGTAAKYVTGIIGGLAYAVKRTFVNTAMEMEEFRVMLANLEGSSNKAEKAMDWIKDFSRTTPFQIAETAEAFIKLRTHGFDPTTGLLRDLGNMASSKGKPIMQAVEAITNAVAGENEPLEEFGIKAHAEGDRVSYSFRDSVAEAQLDDREGILNALRQIMQEYEGSMEARSKTFRGMFDNLLDSWTIFQDALMQSGPLQLLRGRLQNLLDTINRMAEDGSLQELAERVGTWLVDAFHKAEATIQALWPWVLRLGKALSWAAGALGGWDRLALALGGLYVARPFLSLTGALRDVAGWSVKALKRVRKLGAASAGSKTATHMLGGTRYPLPVATQRMMAPAGGASKVSRLGALFRPLTALLGLVSIKFIAIGAVAAVVAGLIYKYWGPISGFFIGLWDSIQVGASAAWEWIKGIWTAAVEWFKGLSLFEAGKALIASLGQGIRAAPGTVWEAAKSVLGKVGDLLPSSDAKEGPLSRLTASGAAILETMGLGVLRAGPGGLQLPLARTLGTATAGLALGVGGAGGPAVAGPGPVTVDQSIHIQQLIVQQQPGEDAGVLAEKVLREIEERRRLAAREALYDEL